MTSEKAMRDIQLMEIFIKVCVTEFRQGNRPGAHLSKTGWKNLVSNFNLATGRTYNKKQLKNRWDTLKKEYGIWKRLMRNETILGWDVERGTINMPSDWWTEKIKELPEVAKFRERSPIFLEDQQLLFNDTIATGENAWTPSQGVLLAHLLDTDNVEELGESSTPYTFLDSAPDNIDGEPLVSKRKNSLPTLVLKEPKNKNTSKAIVVGMTSVAETCKHIQEYLSAKDKATKSGISITDCLEVLYKMPEVVDIEESDEAFTFSLDLFDNLSYREIFTGLRSDAARLAWNKAKMDRESTKNP